MFLAEFVDDVHICIDVDFMSHFVLGIIVNFQEHLDNIPNNF